MTPEQREKITKAAIDHHQKSERIQMMGVWASSTEPEKKQQMAVEYALAQAEWLEAKQKLDEAIGYHAT